MKRGDKNLMIATIVLAIIIILLFWYITLPSQKYYKLETLTGITFQPCNGDSCPPIFTFTFSQPIAESSILSTTAYLKSFKADPNADPAAGGLIASLLYGGGVPFVPVPGVDALTITSNSMPNAISQATPLSVTGHGIMWFALP